MAGGRWQVPPAGLLSDISVVSLCAIALIDARAAEPFAWHTFGRGSNGIANANHRHIGRVPSAAECQRPVPNTQHTTLHLPLSALGALSVQLGGQPKRALCELEQEAETLLPRLPHLAGLQRPHLLHQLHHLQHGAIQGGLPRVLGAILGSH